MGDESTKASEVAEDKELRAGPTGSEEKGASGDIEEEALLEERVFGSFLVEDLWTSILIELWLIHG